MPADEPNHRLRAAREACPSPLAPGEPMSRAELAEAVNEHLWRTTGRHHSLDAHAIARYERGKVRWPSAPYRAGLKAVLGATSEIDLGLQPTGRGRNQVPTSKTADRASPNQAQTTGFGLGRSSFGCVAVTPGSFGEANSAERAAETVQAFRAADRQVGGGHLYTAVQHYSATLLGPQLGAATTDDAVFCAAAGITEMSGWMAHDAGWHQLAAQHFRRAHQLARVGGDTSLTAQIMASRSHLALYTAQVDDAQRWAESGWQLLGGQEDKAVRLRLLAMRARAAASMGEGDKFRELLRQAERLSEAQDGEPSPWTSPFDGGSLASEASRALCDLGDFAASMTYAHRVLELRSAERPRARALARLVLATALIGRGEIDHACAQVQEVSATIGGIASRVVAQQLGTAVGSLRRFDSSGLVVQALPALEATMAQTRQQLHGLGGHEQEGCGGARL